MGVVQNKHNRGVGMNRDKIDNHKESFGGHITHKLILLYFVFELSAATM